MKITAFAFATLQFTGCAYAGLRDKIHNNLHHWEDTVFTTREITVADGASLTDHNTNCYATIQERKHSTSTSNNYRLKFSCNGILEYQYVTIKVWKPAQLAVNRDVTNVENGMVQYIDIRDEPGYSIRPNRVQILLKHINGVDAQGRRQKEFSG